MESPQSAEELIRAHATVPLPRTTDGIVTLFKRVIVLGYVQEVSVTPTGFSVTRMVNEGEAVIPESSDGPVDLKFTLESVERHAELDQLAFDPEKHPYLALEEATRKLSDRGLFVSHLAAHDPAEVSALFALSVEKPTTLLGFPILYDHELVQSGTVVVFGGRSRLLSDVVAGIIIDMGI